MAERLETLVDGFGQAAGPWQTIFNGTLVPPYNNAFGSWGNLPGGAAVGGFFTGHERRRITKIGMQWQPIGSPYDGAGRYLSFFHAPSQWETYHGLDLADMDLLADGVYREYVLPGELVARGVQWSRGFNDGPVDGYLYKIRVFTDDFTPASVAQGRIGQFAPSSSDAPVVDGASGAWEIVRENGDTDAHHNYPRGWNVGWDGTRLVVQPPPAAPVGVDYQVRFRE